ncbi:hypothetical protein PYCCODRAFT_542151 [Trametes coccinea BRFM310]|uniref:Uncharacterized protein n=1 Tax=Trametes coccinea (strain BRFM310) TaxID=1353009 RepID=A0A1Y2IJP7_TRAC3|nr:hypothetical protein PYCCODRAFT_542151 [Trametes coccinea BRFM310]
MGRRCVRVLYCICNAMSSASQSYPCTPISSSTDLCLQNGNGGFRLLCSRNPADGHWSTLARMYVYPSKMQDAGRFRRRGCWLHDVHRMTPATLPLAPESQSAAGGSKTVQMRRLRIKKKQTEQNTYDIKRRASE